MKSTVTTSFRESFRKFSAECMDIEGKCALITDGTRGVGFALANELLEKKTATVIITGSDQKEGANAADVLKKCYGNDKVEFHALNVNSDYEFENTFKYIKENFKAVDIFFNNAEAQHEKDIINTNLVSKIQGIILACKYMKECGGVIINHSSVLGLDADPNMVVYSAASAGFITASRAFSDDIYLNETKIRMMTLCSEHDLPVFVEMGKFAPGTPPEDQDAARYLSAFKIAKSAVYLIRCAPRNTIWLCQQNGTLSIVELQNLYEFSIKFEPKIETIVEKK